MEEIMRVFNTDLTLQQSLLYYLNISWSIVLYSKKTKQKYSVQQSLLQATKVIKPGFPQIFALCPYRPFVFGHNPNIFTSFCAVLLDSFSHSFAYTVWPPLI